MVGIVEADADNLGRPPHQRQIGILGHLHQSSARLRGVGSQVDTARQQRLQRFAAKDAHPFGGANAEGGHALVEEMDIAHGNVLLW
ncbi:hypothetical protein D3C78_1189830 [compost metagenome]